MNNNTEIYKIPARFRRIENLHILLWLWITANCLWMTGEFYGWDEGPWGARRLALIPFSIGLGILIYYYAFLGHKKSFRKEMILQAEELVKEDSRQRSATAENP